MLRIEGLAKLTGAERYVDDLPMDGALWGMTVRSEVARGVVRSIEFDPALDWSSFTIVTPEDITGPNEVHHIECDQPILASPEVRHIGEAVALLAHEDRDTLRAAIRRVKVNIDHLPPALDYRVDPEPDQIQRGEDNVFTELRIDKGGVDAAFAGAAHVVEGEYECGAQEHIYIEPQGMIAWVDDNGVVCCKGSMQCPYYVVSALTHAFGRPEERVRVIQTPTGGGFGGKEDYPSVIALHAALLAIKAGRPVRIIYDRDEDMLATTKRHPALMRHRTAVSADGKLLAQDIDVIMDGGAYVTLSPVVLSRGIIHGAGPYTCPNVRIRGRAVLTNTTPFGAFRGFGAPQTHFANERHMDAVAHAIGMDPVQFRRINIIRDGETTATGQVIRDGADRIGILDSALTRSRYRQLQREHADFNASSPDKRRGVGLAYFHHGAGFTGAGEVYLSSIANVAGLPDGSVEIRAASTEMGQGKETVFTQIVANRLGIDPARVRTATPDSSQVPNSGPTVASRTTMVVGHLLERACDDLRTIIGAPDARGDSLHAAIERWCDANPGAEPVGAARYRPPPGVHWDDKAYKGDAYGTYTWAAYVADVEIDLRTCAATVRAFTAVQDVGAIVNPTLAAGQVHGGVVQAIGWALMEDCVWRDGAMANNQLTNYIIPTADDTPHIDAVFFQTPYEFGAMGSKGLGELPMDGPAPAIANAISDALGLAANRIPLTPERIFTLLTNAQHA
jgi:CO/xanthine dehydrogenase Mo-binding subunit